MFTKAAITVIFFALTADAVSLNTKVTSANAVSLNTKVNSKVGCPDGYHYYEWLSLACV